MSELMVGQMVEVKQYKEEDWCKEPRELVWHKGGKYFCVSSVDPTNLTGWECARAIPEPTALTKANFPKCAVMVRGCGEELKQLVLSIGPDTVITSTRTITYENLQDGYDWSFDWGDTWSKVEAKDECY